MTYAQYKNLRGTWITFDQDLISIVEASGINWVLLSNKLYDVSCTESIICGDTIKSYYKHYYCENNFSEPYYFKILFLSDTFLIVKPISEYSKKFFQSRDTIKFVRQEYAVDTTIKFEKIVYHTSGECLSDFYCPEINLQIDNKKNIYIDCGFFKKDNNYDYKHSGQFAGKLSKKLYNELIYILQTCNLKTLTYGYQSITDNPEITFIIYFNGQRKYLKSTDPPFIVRRLINFLNTINSRANLTRTNEKIDLEK